MNLKLRNALVAAGLLVGGTVAGTGIVAIADGSPAPSQTRVPEVIRGDVSTVFVPIASYRTLDSRGPSTEKFVRSVDNSLNPGLPTAHFVQFEQGGDGTIQFPDEAVAVTYNVTVTETEGAGFVQIDGYGNASGTTSTVNWSGADQTVANSGVAILTDAFDDPGALGIWVGGAPDAKAHVVLDITGYYMPVI